METKKNLILFRESHSWKETRDQFPDINPETWRRWLINKSLILNANEKLEIERSKTNKKNYQKQYRADNPYSKFKDKHPFVHCCYLANGGFKRRLTNQTNFIPLLPRQLVPILKKQRMLCALTGIKLTGDNISVDHIIHVSKGGSHTVDNIRLVHKAVNKMRNDYDDEFFFSICCAVAKNFKSAQGQVTS